MFRFRGRLMEVAPLGDYKGSPYSSIVVRAEDIAGGVMIRYKLDLSKVEYSSLHDMLDEDVVVSVEIIKGMNSAASLKAVEISA